MLPLWVLLQERRLVLNGILLKEFNTILRIWEIDKGKESSINYEYDSIKSFVETDSFDNLSAKFGLDSQIFFISVNISLLVLISKYHKPLKDICEINSRKELQVHTVTPILPVVYVENPPFPVRIKEHTMVTSVVHKSGQRYHEFEDK